MNDFIASLKSRPELLAAIARFNAPLAGDFDPEALPSEAAALLRGQALSALEGSALGRRLTRAWLFRLMGIEGVVFTDFSEESRRLALLPREEINRLGLLYGACAYAQEAARCVKREEVMTLRSSLGAHYAYALQRGRFQAQKARDWALSFKKELPLPERITAAGLSALRSCLAAWPEALRALAAPRLPAGLRAAAPEAARDSLPPAELFWPDLKKLLLSEVAPSWQACFA